MNLRRIRALSNHVGSTNYIVIIRTVNHGSVTVSSLSDNSHIAVRATSCCSSFHSIACSSSYVVPTKIYNLVTSDRTWFGRCFWSYWLRRHAAVDQSIVFCISSCHIYLRPEAMVGKFRGSIVPCFSHFIKRSIVFVQQILPLRVIYDIWTDIGIACIYPISAFSRIGRHC
ncbi:hypothetical protein D3C76_1134480 [compost metagenome]